MQRYNSGLFAEQGIKLHRAPGQLHAAERIVRQASHMFWLRLIQTLLRPCKHTLHWQEIVLPFLLYTHYD